MCDAYGVGLVVDEAHSIFALGKRGGGATEMYGEESRVRLLFGTFSKALSMVGGFASASADLVGYLRLYAHPFGFSAALAKNLQGPFSGEAWMALELKPGSLENVNGTVRYPFVGGSGRRTRR